MRRMQDSTLPLTNASWRDDFRIDQSQPFQGVVGVDSFEIARISVAQVRRATPPKIKGWVNAMPGSAGSEIQIRCYIPATLLWFIGFMSALAFGLLAVSMVRDWHRMGGVNPLGLIYFVPPVWVVVVQYFQLKGELDAVQLLLGRLLALKETAV